MLDGGEITVVWASAVATQPPRRLAKATRDLIDDLVPNLARVRGKSGVTGMVVITFTSSV
jgi:hypothetical protein